MGNAKLTFDKISSHRSRPQCKIKFELMRLFTTNRFVLYNLGGNGLSTSPASFTGAQRMIRSLGGILSRFALCREPSACHPLPIATIYLYNS